jgi:NitT/TauT family transport system substrate-binding protein
VVAVTYDTLAAARIRSAQQPETVIIGLVGLSTNSIHPFISKEAGLFLKYGVDSRLVVFEGGSILAQASVAGEVKFSDTSGPVTIASRSGGADSVIIAGHMNILPYSLATAKGITRWDQLKGKRIAISRFGSGTDTAIRLVLTRFGLNPDKDVTIVQLGAQPSRFAALVAGGIEATLVAPPFDVTAKKQEFPILVDMAPLGIPYPQQVFETTDRLIRERPQLVKNVLKGFIAGLNYGFTHPEQTKRIMAKYLKISDPEILERTYQHFTESTDRKAYPDMDGVRYGIEEVAKRIPTAKGKKPEDFVNLKFLYELEKEGFFKELSK